jgi:hypothetical protein
MYVGSPAPGASSRGRLRATRYTAGPGLSFENDMVPVSLYGALRTVSWIGRRVFENAPNTVVAPRSGYFIENYAGYPSEGKNCPRLLVYLPGGRNINKVLSYRLFNGKISRVQIHVTAGSRRKIKAPAGWYALFNTRRF